MYKITIELPRTIEGLYQLVFFVDPRNKLIYSDSVQHCLLFNSIPEKNKFIENVLCCSISYDLFKIFMTKYGLL